MATDTQAVRTVRRFVARVLWTVAGVVVALFLYSSKYLISGITLGGVKG